MLKIYSRRISGTMEDFHFLSVTGHRLIHVYSYIRPCAIYIITLLYFSLTCDPSKISLSVLNLQVDNYCL